MNRLFALIFLLGLASPAFAFNTVNELGVATAPVSVLACPTVTKVITGSKTSTSWAIMPEGADIRCNVGTSADVSASPVPTATVGILLKSNVIVEETTLSTLRVDCCGVAGAVPTDTWHE